MSRQERGFVPIDEANSERLRFNLDLPHYLDRTRIRANPGRTESMMKLGGISHLRVDTFEADRVTSSPLIIGQSSEGGLTQVKREARKERKSLILKGRRVEEVQQLMLW